MKSDFLYIHVVLIIVSTEALTDNCQFILLGKKCACT